MCVAVLCARSLVLRVSVKYEPFVVVHRSAQLPYFDERFDGYGKNRLEVRPARPGP